MTDTAAQVDRNKTGATRHLTAAVGRWLDERGFKPVETEVQIDRGWVADLAGVIVPTMTECTRLRLVSRRPAWGSPRMAEWEGALAQVPSPVTGIVEVKTSKSDFRADDKWDRSCPADLAWLAVPEGLVTARDIPDRWGLIVHGRCGDWGCRVVRHAKLCPVSVEQRLWITLQIAVRRDHHTRYARHRDLQRSARAADNEVQSRLRMDSAVRLVCSYVNGECDGLDEAMRHNSIRHLPPYLKEKLDKLRETLIQTAAT